MNLISLLLALSLLLTAERITAQHFRIASPPVDGYFHIDTVCDPQAQVCYSAKCIDIICDNNTVYASGAGKVLYCYTHGNRTYEIGIKYTNSMVIYYNVKKKAIQKGQPVKEHMMIGELEMNPKDQKYHLGLQVLEAPNRFLWYKKLVTYLNASLVVN